MSLCTRLRMIRTNTSELPFRSESHHGAKSADELGPNLVTDGFHVFEVISLVLALPINTSVVAANLFMVTVLAVKPLII